MKLSIVVSTQPASFTALAYKGSLAENLRKIKRYGYEGVELAVRDPNLLDLNDLTDMLQENVLPVPAIGTGQAFGEEGLSFTHPDKSVRQKAIDRIRSQILLAERLNSIVIIGLIRGRRGKDITEKLAHTWMNEAIQICAGENPEVKLAIEPINRYETDLLNTVAASLKFAESLKMENIGLLLDTFHMNIEESSITKSIEMAKDRLFHFHVADSNRWYPGGGHIDFVKVIETLESIGYKGFISAEILPVPDPDTAAAETIKHLKRIIK